MKKLLLLLVLGIMVSGCSFRGSRNVDPVVAAAVAEKVMSDNYIVTFDVMTPVRGRSFTLSHPWDIRIEGGRLYSYLPYVGEAYVPLLGPGEGLDFEAEIRDYTVNQGRRGVLEIEFWVVSADDRYEYYLSIYPDGGAYLRVMPDRKSAVTYDGKLDTTAI